jgi:hypothetical protein
MASMFVLGYINRANFFDKIAKIAKAFKVEA